MEELPLFFQSTSKGLLLLERLLLLVGIATISRNMVVLGHSNVVTAGCATQRTMHCSLTNGVCEADAREQHGEQCSCELDAAEYLERPSSVLSLVLPRCQLPLDLLILYGILFRMSITLQWHCHFPLQATQ